MVGEVSALDAALWKADDGEPRAMKLNAMPIPDITYGNYVVTTIYLLQIPSNIPKTVKMQGLYSQNVVLNM